MENFTASLFAASVLTQTSAYTPDKGIKLTICCFLLVALLALAGSIAAVRFRKKLRPVIFVALMALSVLVFLGNVILALCLCYFII